MSTSLTSSTPKALAPIPRAPWSAALNVFGNPYAFVMSARERYGEIFQLNLGLTKVVILSHPKHIAHVLRDNAKNYPKEGSMWDNLRSLLGNGLIISQGEEWKRRRRMMQPHFQPSRLTAVIDAMADAIGEVVAGLATQTDRPLDMNRLCSRMTMTATVRAIFGTDIADADVRAVGDSLTYALDYVMRGMVLQAVPNWMPLPGRKRYQECLETIDDVIYRMIDRRRRGGKGGDLLSILIDLRDEDTDEGMSDQELDDEVLNLFLAGYETTATGMAWALYSVAEQPEIACRIREEVREVIGAKRPRLEHLSRLQYTRMVVKEAFRLYPAAWQTMRTAVEDDSIGGFHVPAGTQVVLSLLGSHHHPDVWPDPETFDPLRFEAAREKDRGKEAWMPFGIGQRMCIGRELSLMEGSLILAQLLRRYDLSSIPGRVPRPKLSLVTTNHDGIWLRLSSAL